MAEKKKVRKKKGKKLDIRPSEKQGEAYTVLYDSDTDALLYGGAAGGGKSWLGCEWLMINCLRYPGSRYFIGRETLKDIHVSTLLTLFKVFRYYGIPPSWYKLNSQYNYLEIRNGGKGEVSRIDLLDCKKQPSDPMFERFGSMEFTSGWLEEAGEIAFEAFDVLKSRVGRCNNDKYGIKSKILLTANPNKGWLYQFFYKRKKENELPHNIKFVQAFVWDNPFIESGYRQQLEDISDPVTRQRLLHGIWEYESADSLMDYDTILDLFKNDVDSGKKYLTVDAARYGNDKATIWLWEGFTATLLKVIPKSSLTTLTDEIDVCARDHGVQRSHIMVDEVGVGGGVVDNLPGCKGFIANASPKKHKKLKNTDGKKMKENYGNLKAQCAYLFAKRATDRGIKIIIPPDAGYMTDNKFVGSSEIRREVIAELEQIRRKDPDKEGKLMIIPKDEVKAALGRSPDYSDALIMREALEMTSTSGSGVFRGSRGGYGIFG